MMSRPDSYDRAVQPLLERRMARILRMAVERFVATGEPVGSRTLSKMEGEHLSPASIRNAMSDLEEMGYLFQPHVSAGRVPTDKGYRYYVDTLMGEPMIPPEEQKEIALFFDGFEGEVGPVLESTSKLLSRFSHYIGIVSVPHFESTVFRHIEFIRQAPGLILVILISRSGMVHNKLIRVGGDYNQEELDKISRWVVDTFQGLTLAQVRTRVEEMLRQERSRFNDFIRKGLIFSLASFAGGFREDDIFVEGAANIVIDPVFSEPEKLRQLITAIEEKKVLVELLNKCLSSSGVQIAIGSETEISDVADCSIVASSYNLPDGSCGTVAVLGPTRMPYSRTIFLVDFISKRISALVS
jgi:heat-inducible transcriptional repressor